MHAYDETSWRLPFFDGRIKCRNVAFHFWDATDDFSKTNLDLLFEGHRLYLHGANGKFGAVPMSLTGDILRHGKPNNKSGNLLSRRLLHSRLECIQKKLLFMTFEPFQFS